MNFTGIVFGFWTAETEDDLPIGTDQNCAHWRLVRESDPSLEVHVLLCGRTDMNLAKPPEDIHEALAAIEHERWADWQSYVHSLCVHGEDGSFTIPAALAERWERQIATPYGALSDQEKASDREQVERYWSLIAPLVDPGGLKEKKEAL